MDFLLWQISQDFELKINELVSMGFSESDARYALSRCNGNLEVASTYLLNYQQQKSTSQTQLQFLLSSALQNGFAEQNTLDCDPELQRAIEESKREQEMGSLTPPPPDDQIICREVLEAEYASRLTGILPPQDYFLTVFKAMILLRRGHCRKRLAAAFRRHKLVHAAGDPVRCAFLGAGGPVRAGTVARARPDGTVDVDYAHGAREVRVPRGRLLPPPPPALAPATSSELRSGSPRRAPDAAALTAQEKIDRSILHVAEYRVLGDGQHCLEALRTYTTNALVEDKFRHINMENKFFKTRVRAFIGGTDYLKAIGFTENEEEHKLHLAEPNEDLLRYALVKLDDALSAYAARHDAPAPGGGGDGDGGGGGGDPKKAPPARQPSHEEAILAGRVLLEQRLAHLRWREMAMEDDGNCQFRAFSQEFYGTQKYHGYIRERACNYMEQHIEEFDVFFEEGEFPNYLRKMRKSRTWGDELTLRAVAEEYGVRVHVMTSTEENWYLHYDPHDMKSLKQVFLTYISPIHYNCIDEAKEEAEEG